MPETDPGADRQTWQRKVRAKETRKLNAPRDKKKAVWFGLGMFGLIGWSVAIPTLIATAIGIWIDTHWPSRFSWTLMLLFVGVVLGCLNAWNWIKKESQRDT